MVEVGHWHARMHLRSLRLAGAEIAGVSDRQPGVATLDDGRRASVEIPDQRARYDRLAGDTLARLRTGQRPVATLEDCYEAMCVVDEVYRIAASTDGPRSHSPSA